MTEHEEAIYMQGEQAAALSMLASIRHMLNDEARKEAGNLAELFESRRALHHLFEDLDIEWPGDDLWLPDVIEKHLGRNLEPSSGTVDNRL